MKDCKVFISCPINVSKGYCIDDFFDNIINYNYNNLQYYFVDNSHDKWFRKNLINRYGFEIDHVNPKGKEPHEYMADSMNMCLVKFLNSDCDFWFINECDVFCDKDVINRLLSKEKLIVASPYFIQLSHNSCLVGTECEKLYGNYTNRPLSWKEDFIKFNGLENKVTSAGFGAVLIHRSILEGYTFHAKENCFADTMFYMDMTHQNIDVYRDESLIAKHRNISWDLNTEYKK